MSKTAIVWEDLAYFPDTGLVYRTDSCKGMDNKTPIGSKAKGGYLQATYKKKQYKIHRLAWRVFYGEWPSGQIDHINKDTSDNRISNLRCGNSVNQHNRDIKTGKSKLSGAHASNKAGKPWKSSIKIDGVAIHLGYFKTAQEAHEVYMKHKEGLLNG